MVMVVNGSLIKTLPNSPDTNEQISSSTSRKSRHIPKTLPARPLSLRVASSAFLHLRQLPRRFAANPLPLILNPPAP